MATRKIVCDTDVLIDYLNADNERHVQSKYILEEVIELENVVLSAITKMELLIGAKDKLLLSRVNKNIHIFEILLIDNDITKFAIQLLQEYNLSHGLALADALIAATSIVSNTELFTYNIKDYKFIKRLTLFQSELE